MKREFSRAEIVKICSKTGVSGIEWGLENLENAAADAREMHKLTRDAGLDVVSYINAGKLWKTDEIRRWSEAIAESCGKVLRVAHPWYAWNYQESLHQPDTFNDLLKKSREGLERLIEISREFGIRYVLETHSGACVASPLAVKYLMEGLDPQCVGAIYDPANTYLEGFIRPRGAVEVMGPYLAYVHVKNLVLTRLETGNEWRSEKCALDSGMVNYEEVIFALKLARYDGWFSFEELFSGRENFEAEIRDGIKHLQACAAKAPDALIQPFLTLND
jgi:sugar phosphate isomerase/epimerase